MSKQFEVDKTYTCRSICDYDCIYSFTIKSRTAKFVTIDGTMQHNKRRKVYLDRDGVECIDPHGVYSMSPVLRAAGH